MLRNLRYISSAVFALFVLSGCDPTPDDGDAGHIEAMREIALSYGAQSGLNWKSTETADYLDAHATELDKVFNFNALLMRNNVLPPVVAQYGKTYTVESDSSVRISDKEIKMVRPARFVSVAPTWRDYIYLVYQKPEEPPQSLLPTNDYEHEIWKQSLLAGWTVGVEQASAIFQDSLSRLSHDFEGMVLYRKLHIQNMISAPYTETTNLGVTGDNQGLRLNDKIIKIQCPSVLNPQTNQWHPILYDSNS